MLPLAGAMMMMGVMGMVVRHWTRVHTPYRRRTRSQTALDGVDPKNQLRRGRQEREATDPQYHEKREKARVASRVWKVKNKEKQEKIAVDKALRAEARRKVRENVARREAREARKQAAAAKILQIMREFLERKAAVKILQIMRERKHERENRSGSAHRQVAAMVGQVGAITGQVRAAGDGLASLQSTMNAAYPPQTTPDRASRARAGEKIKALQAGRSWTSGGQVTTPVAGTEGQPGAVTSPDGTGTGSGTSFVTPTPKKAVGSEVEVTK